MITTSLSRIRTRLLRLLYSLRSVESLHDRSHFTHKSFPHPFLRFSESAKIFENLKNGSEGRLIKLNILITGPTASGKSTLVNKLATTFHLPVIRKSQLLEKAANTILKTVIHPDYIKHLSITQIQSIYDETEKYLQIRLNNPYIQLIDDHLCVLVDNATIWKRAPINYINTHKIGWGLVINPTEAQIIRNYNSDDKNGIRNRLKFDINFFKEEISIIFDILNDWEKKGIIHLINIKNISAFLENLSFFLDSKKIAPIFILNQLNFQDMYLITKNIVSKVLKLFKNGTKKIE